ncbi:hypothetical protein MD484_g1128, partial [Candolleomyces efflorescens]
MPTSRIDWSKVDNPAIAFQHFPSRRSVVYGTKGVVASSQPLATAAGLEILRKGGNAADAAVATSAALNVTEPCNCGIGGDAFCLFYDATTKKITALNGSGRAPKKLNLEYARQRGLKGSIPLTDLNSVTVPGAPAAWLDTIDQLGNGNVTIADIFAPAIRLAENGYPVSELSSYYWQHSEQLLKRASPNGDEMLLNGRAPRPGEVICLPNLAKTFKELVARGKDGFYKGRVAQAIVDLIQGQGGVMELEDLSAHTSTFVEPIKYTYAGELTVYECPPNGQGITALIALGILEQMQEQGLIPSLLELPHNSPEYLHALIEALRLAFADSQWYVTDPEVSHIPVEELLSKGHPVNSSDTVYFTGKCQACALSERDTDLLKSQSPINGEMHAAISKATMLGSGREQYPKDVDSRCRIEAATSPSTQTIRTYFKEGRGHITLSSQQWQLAIVNYSCLMALWVGLCSLKATFKYS